MDVRSLPQQQQRQDHAHDSDLRSKKVRSLPQRKCKRQGKRSREIGSTDDVRSRRLLKVYTLDQIGEIVLRHVQVYGCDDDTISVMAEKLQLPERRLYDVFGVFEGLGLVTVRVSKTQAWLGRKGFAQKKIDIANIEHNTAVGKRNILKMLADATLFYLIKLRRIEAGERFELHDVAAYLLDCEKTIRNANLMRRFYDLMSVMWVLGMVTHVNVGTYEWTGTSVFSDEEEDSTKSFF